MKKRLWFNHWFNSAYHFIKLIKENPDGMEFEIYSTNRNENSVIFQISDYYEIEPKIEDTKEYIEYCLEFCTKHKIDVFFPRNNMIAISEHIREFEKIGTKVLVTDNSDMLKIISDKGKFYEFCKERNLCPLPEYRIVNNVGDFKKAYEEISNKGYRVCFKPVNADGGNGFRVVDNVVDTIEGLFGGISHKIPYNEVVRLLSTKETFDDLMVLEYLNDFEYSIDCLSSNGKLLSAIPRKKVDGRVRHIEYVPELIELAHKIYNEIKLPYVFNIQVKYNEGVPKLLEINPRMSGGLHITCLSGVNYPYLALKTLLGENVEVQNPKFDIKVTQIEKEILLEK